MNTGTAPFWLGENNVPLVMRRVVLALLPVTLCATFYFGLGLLLNVALLVAFCLVTEAALVRMRGRNVRQALTDGSALVTALLLALALPPGMSWWTLLIAALFAIGLAKHVYGGLGQNPFNPAMVGYVTVLVAFPEQAAVWPGLTPGLMQGLTPAIDAVSGATPLDSIKMQLGQMRTMAEITAQADFGMLAGRGWEWINLSALAGGIWLMRKQVISWHVPGAMLATLAALYFVFYAFSPATHPSPILGLLSGGTMLAAFFVATDPVSGAASNSGKIVFGMGVAVLCFAMRKWGAYPDGIGFAVLIMNMAVPLIDRVTVPRIYGHKKGPRI